MEEENQKLKNALKNLLGTINAHECTCFSCDRDGELHCDCLEREAKKAQKVLDDSTKPQ